MSRARRVTAALITCLTGLALLASLASAHSTGRVLASAGLSVSHGGEVRAPNGWRLYVPPHTVERNGRGTITAEGNGKFNVHINVPWRGKVAVSAPLSGAHDGILHHLGGVWVAEGRSRGQRKVWATQLSIFGTIKSAVSGVTCLSFDPHAVIACLVKKGISKVNSKLGSWIAGKISSSCLAALVADGLTGEEVGIALAIFNDPACTGVASSPGLPAPSAGSAGGGRSPAPAPIPAPAPAPGVPAPGGGAHPVFTVMNTSETPPDGVWFRNSPHTGDTDRVTGHGVYMGEQVELLCYRFGDAVGPYNDSLWYDVIDVSRPTNAGVSNSGWLNAHYINDGLVANQVDAGVVPC